MKIKIVSVAKIKALKWAERNLGRFIPTQELEKALGMTPNQRQRVYTSLKRSESCE